jgi:hypothetical protein
VTDTAVLVYDSAQVIVDGRAGLLAVAPALLAERREEAQLGADLPRGPIGHRLAGLGLSDEVCVVCGGLTQGLVRRPGRVVSP